MKYAYLSSGRFGAEVLKHLTPAPSVVVTQPDRLGGRGMKQLLPTPVKELARASKFTLFENMAETNLTNFDLALVADYGVIIKEKLLSLPKHGFWNIHPSLLPKYRGTSPLQTALKNGDQTTGVTVIKLDAKMDHGLIVDQQEMTIDINDNLDSLLKKTALIGAGMFNKLILTPPDRLNYREQNHTEATYTKKLTKVDGHIAPQELTPYLEPILKKYNLTHLLPKSTGKPIDPLRLHNMIRALTPWPGVWTELLPGKIAKLTDSHLSGNNLSITVKIDGHSYLL